MYYKTGIDITNDKQMFTFLKNHFEYYTANSWNELKSIANNVKLYNLHLSGDWCVTYNFLNEGEYDNINWMIADWQAEHSGYTIGFNGRSDGYLVLYSNKDNSSILPDCIIQPTDYEDYKNYCKENFDSVKANRDNLIFYTKLVQDFDKFCDKVRDFCDELSNMSFEIIEMEKAVEQFNIDYIEDLSYCNFKPLSCDAEGFVNISEIQKLNCLYNAFTSIAKRSDYGYTLEFKETNRDLLGYKKTI